MLDKLEELANRIQELNELLSSPEVASNPRRLRDLSIEHSQLMPIVTSYEELKRVTLELADVLELMGDPEMREMAAEEKPTLEARIQELRQEIRKLLLPKDPYEGRNLLVEIRAGTGGDEAALFASDLFRMYARYCGTHRFKVEVLSTSEIVVGGSSGKSAVGFKEIICLISGKDAYAHLKYEAGVHRVQRVPLTETQGRIHTSAATVAILPEPDEVEIHIDPSDIRIDVFRASGPGGQSVNTTDSAVRLTHLASGLVVICQDEKSQHKNKAKALKVLKARLFEKQEAERHAEEAATRRAQVGTGDRSERIRTYNYPQNRVTDHRIGETVYKLDQIVGGRLELIAAPVIAWFQAEALRAAES
jgi:peptide chain release factor 1